ncbi:MAG: hypothetical protein Q8P93_05035 [bacterium]|nr:hypothetical protein [bacterium]
MQILLPDLNPPLDSIRINEFRELVTEIATLCERKQKIRLFYSNRLRAVQSARILIQDLGVRRFTEIVESKLICEVCHGRFKIDNYKQGDIYPPLVMAWTLWAEALADMDIDYRYGNHIRKGEIKYPALTGVFTQFGENHREFTIRLYSFLIDLIQCFYSNPNIFNIVLAHQATLSRIQRVFNALTTLRKIPAEGMLVRRIERASERVSIKESHGVTITYPPKALSISILRQEINNMKL